MNFLTGEIIPVNKPYKWTSFGVVARMRWLLTQKLQQKVKVGHAGTLDPLATGVLLLCTGRATKRIEELQAHQKEYIATLKLGVTTQSYDREYPEDKTYPTDHINLQFQFGFGVFQDIDGLDEYFLGVELDIFSLAGQVVGVHPFYLAG